MQNNINKSKCHKSPSHNICVPGASANFISSFANTSSLACCVSVDTVILENENDSSLFSSGCKEWT